MSGYVGVPIIREVAARRQPRLQGDAGGEAGLTVRRRESDARVHETERIPPGPGPSMADPRALRAMSAPLLGQFDPDFTRMMNEVMDLCRLAFETTSVAAFPVSGTGRAALEAAIVSLVEPGERVVVGECGRFGLLLIEIAERAGAEVVPVRAEWGRVVR